MHRQTPFTRFVDDLARTYESLHTAMDDALWRVYMGTAADPEAARHDLSAKEVAAKAFLSEPERLRSVREQLAAANEADDGNRPTDDERLALEGWLRTFEAHVIESAEARRLMEEIVEDEARLAQARDQMTLGYVDPAKGFLPASSVKLSVLLATDPDEQVRRAAWDGLRTIETEMLAHGFAEILRKRNRLGRLLGGDDYYDATVRRVEGLTKEQVFGFLDELEERTRRRGADCLREVESQHGAAARDPWNLRYLAVGNVTTAQDPYFPFACAIERWGRSFAGLGVSYRGATLVLDLVDRKGKYENGFAHAPVVAWRFHGEWRPARVHFTANAIPGMVGSGRRAMETLFHEGGHAAHFANVDMPAPCYSHEDAPTSVAFAETQSMFLDSLISDADWKTRYARDRHGATMPLDLIERGLVSVQPLQAWNLRSMMTVCYAEKALYELDDDQLVPDRILATLRDAERRLVHFGAGSPRPVLSVPHLLSSGSSAYYHGYVLAQIAVEQTRSYFRERDGHLIDNPRIGPDLRESYWRDGNRYRFTEFVERLTGKPLAAVALADRANRDVATTLAEAREEIRHLAGVPAFDGVIDLDARVRVVHGTETIATNDGGFDELSRSFESWIEAQASQTESP